MADKVFCRDCIYRQGSWNDECGKTKRIENNWNEPNHVTYRICSAKNADNDCKDFKGGFWWRRKHG